MKVCITGGSGFVGSHLVRHFSRKGHEVTVLVRENSDLRFIEKYPCQLKKVSLADVAQLREALVGMDVIVHAAAKASDWGKWQSFYDVNVTGTVNLYQAAPHNAHFIHVSTNAVLGEEDCLTPKKTSASYLPKLPYFMENWLPSAMNFYRQTKAIAEKQVIERARQDSRPLTVVRPVWVYGPREFHAGPYEYCDTVNSGLPLMPGTKKNRYHVIYVKDLARIILQLAEQETDGVRIFNAGHPDVPLMEEYWTYYCQAMKKRKPLNIPKWVLYPLALLMEMLYTVFGSKNPPLFTRARVYLFYASNVYDVEEVLTTTGITELTPLEQGIATTVRWWKLNGYL